MINKENIMKLKNYIITGCGLFAFAASAFATDYTTTKTINGTSETLYGGDTISVRSAYGARVTNGGSLNVLNTDSSGLNISIGSSGSPMEYNEVSGNVLRAAVFDNSTLNCGDNFNINIYSNSDNISARGLLAANSTVTMGDNASIELHGIYGSANSAAIVANSSVFTIGQNLTVKADNKGKGIDAQSQSSVTVGIGADIVAEIGIFARLSSVTMDSATIKGVGENGLGIYLGADANASFTNSTIEGYKNAIRLQADAQGAGYISGLLTFDGGSVSSQTGTLIVNEFPTSVRDQAIASEIIFKNGAQAVSGNGVLYDSVSITYVESEIKLTIEGAGTKVDGAVLGANRVVIMTVSDSATWSSTGASVMDKLILDNANVEFTLTTQGDAITAGDMSTSGMSDITIDFSNDFLNEITDGFMFDTDTAIIIGSGEKGNINYIIAGQNKDGSTWDVTDNHDGTYTISNINVVPEPATYAVIFGAMALALAAYRRRK